MDIRDASIPEMKNYFGHAGRPVSNTEMMEFWKSLGETTYEYDGKIYSTEKDFFKQGIAKILDEEAARGQLAPALVA